jgi:transposase-like protein
MACQEVWTMARKRRSFSGAYYAKVALAAWRGEKTTAQLAAEFGVHTGRVTAWKKRLLEGQTGLFEDGRSKHRGEDTANVHELYEQIGQLKMEVEMIVLPGNFPGQGRGVIDAWYAAIADTSLRAVPPSWRLPTNQGFRKLLPNDE